MTPPTKAMLELADKIALCAPVTPEGRAAIMLNKSDWTLIENLLRSSQNGERERVIEECAKWHEDQSRLAMNSLHCGDNATTIQMTRIRAEWHDNAAAAIRALKSGEKGS